MMYTDKSRVEYDFSILSVHLMLMFASFKFMALKKILDLSVACKLLDRNQVLFYLVSQVLRTKPVT